MSSWAFSVHEMLLWFPSVDLLMKEIAFQNQAEGSIGYELHQVLPSKKTIQDLADHCSIKKLMDEFSDLIENATSSRYMLLNSGHC